MIGVEAVGVWVPWISNHKCSGLEVGVRVAYADNGTFSGFRLASAMAREVVSRR